LELLKALKTPEIQPAAPGTAPLSADQNPALEALVVLGGPEVSYIPIESEIFRYADFVIRGEGEEKFRELCEDLLFTPQPATDTCVFINAPPVDLNTIAEGYRLYSGEDLCRKLVYVEASRGCPFGCEFCLSSLDQGVREFPLELFLVHMDSLIRRGGRTFKFLDRTFNFNIERAKRIIEFFLDHVDKNRNLTVHFEMVPSRFPPALLELLGRFPRGSLRLELGIQTLNPQCAARIKRPGEPERELEVLETLQKKTKAIIHADLIAGLPGEDLDSFAEGFDRLWAVRPAEIQLGILKCLPGTPLAHHNASWGMQYAENPPYEVLESAALPRKDLDRVKNFARFWELIVNRGNFAALLPALLPPGKGTFARFMELSDTLLERFGKNWGIPRKDLEDALSAFSVSLG
jgi:radical SAM superfamily enzyme YgiQ (UPF0313 family)